MHVGRYDLKHIDRGVIYLPADNDSNIDDIVQQHKDSGKTIVLFRGGKYDMKRILTELLKTKLDA